MPAADTKKKSKNTAVKPAEKLKPASKKNPVPKKAARSEERVVDSSDEDEEGTLEEATEEATEETTEAVTTEKSSTEETSGSGSESEEDSENESTKPSETTSNYKYKPPPSFKIIPPGSSSHNPFSTKNLNGKELWFITTPYAAPLSKLDIINPADIVEGLPVLQTSSGRSYCLRVKDEDEEAEEVDVLVGDGKGGYRIAGKKIAKSFQMVESLPTTKGVTAGVIPKGRPVREQPEGLRMRFKPIGFEGEIEQDGDAEVRDAQMGDVDVEVRPSRGVNANANGEVEHKKKKRKSHKDGEKKEKKHRKKDKGSVNA